MDNVAEIEHMRGIINSFGFYPEYSHFHHAFNAFSRFTSIFIFRLIMSTLREKLVSVKILVLFKIKSKNKLFLTRVNIYLINVKILWKYFILHFINFLFHFMK